MARAKRSFLNVLHLRNITAVTLVNLATTVHLASIIVVFLVILTVDSHWLVLDEASSKVPRGSVGVKDAFAAADERVADGAELLSSEVDLVERGNIVPVLCVLHMLLSVVDFRLSVAQIHLVPMLDVLDVLRVTSVVDFRLRMAKIKMINHIGLEVHELG